MKSPFDRFLPSAPKARQRKASRKAAEFQAEQLEKRAMMAIATWQAGAVSDYLIVASDKASDVYIQQHAGGNLLIADNSSFLANANSDETVGVPDIVYVTNGALGSGPGPMLPGNNSGGNYRTDPVLATQTWFTLNSANIIPPTYDLFTGQVGQAGQRIEKKPPTGSGFFPSDKFQISNRIGGSVTYDGATWQFEFDPDGRLVFSPTPAGNQSPSARPVSGAVDLRGRGALIINWSSQVSTVDHPANRAVPAPPQIDIEYFVPGAAGGGFVGGVGGTAPNRPESEFGLVPTPGFSRTNSTLPYSATAVMTYTFTIPASVYEAAAVRGVIPGSLFGAIVVDGVSIDIEDDFIPIPGQRGTVYLGPDDETTFVVNPFCTISSMRYVSAGNTVTITVNFQGAPRGPAEVTAGRYLAYVEDADPNSFTLFAGHDMTGQLEVDLLTSGSTVDIDSRITTRQTLSVPRSNVEDVVLRATNININSVVNMTDSMWVSPSIVGSAVAETLRVNAPVAAPASFTLDVGDDPATAAARGLIFISPSGSLVGGLPTGGGDSAATELVLVRAVKTDIYATGAIFGKRQSILMNSDQSAQGLAPFVFTTRSPEGGVDSGLIRGDTVSITLGNDAPTPLDIPPSIAFNTVDLSTRVGSMRIKASTQQLDLNVPFPDPSPAGPFPYNLSIREYDDIAFDAVASSGLPISLSATGNIGMSSALNTFSDVSITALRPTDRQVAADAKFDFTVSAPITTTKGRINIQADSVFVNNSVVVTSATVDDTRNDITLTANSGNILLTGLVSGVNGINLTQRNSTESRGTPVAPYFDPNFQPINIPEAAAPADGAGGNAVVTGAATAIINVEDDFQFSDLAVVVSVKHPFVGDLSATLIAPDGRKFKLFDKSSNRGDDYVDTVFDSEATTPIAGATPPYTGRFKPVDSLQPLYIDPETRISTLGTWKLEVIDNTPRDTGTLEKFQLVFSKTGNQVSGSAFIRADRLMVEAEGAVGNPVKQPTASDFYLNTNVDEMVVRAGVSAAINEQDDINIKSLRAGDLVSLKAGGVDPVSGPNAGEKALRAFVIDVPSFDVSTPNGSMEIELNTAKTTILGNAKALQRGSAINSVAAGSVKIRSQAGDIVALDAPVAGGNARLVRVATNVDLNGQFVKGTPGVTADRLLVSKQAMDALRPLNAKGNPLALRVNDRILVKDQGFTNQNGVYSVTSTGAIWTLTRSTDSDTLGELTSGTYVRVGEGDAEDTVWQVTYGLRRAGEVVAGIDKVTGLEKTSDLAVGMLVVGEGIAPDTVIASIDDNDSITLSSDATDTVAVTSLRFVVATPEIGASVMLVEESDITTDIGSDDVNDKVTFVVSTAGGTNSSAGAFGKMVDVYQRNSAQTFAGAQKSEFRFSSLVANNRAPIRLTQELPAIREAIVIDGGAGSRYVPAGVLPNGLTVPANSVASNPVIDGSRITTLRSGRMVTVDDEVNGFTIKNADGVMIRNVIMGGFGKGAAIRVDDSPNVLIDRVVLGQSEVGVLKPNDTGTRLANGIGVHVVGAESDTTTITNSTILSSTDAGIKVENGATYVRVTGNTIGKPGLENNVGVNFASGVNALGIDSAPQVQAMARRVNNNTFTLPAGTFEVARRLVPGMGVIGRRVVQSNPNVPVTITSVAVNEKTKITTVRVTGGRVTSNGSVIIGYVVRTERNSSVISLGVPLDSPEGRSRLMGLYLGQQVNGMGIAFGTTITKITESDPDYDGNATITLSQPMTMTGVTSISLSSVGRNVIQANRTGVILGVGSTTMTNTSVIDSNFNGVEIHGGSHTIGTSKTRSPTSNAIHGNGRWGIAYMSNAVSRALQFIRGNYLGANQSTIVSTVLANKKGNIGPVSDTDDSAYLGDNGQLGPNARTGVDKEGNQHGIMPVVATRGRSRFPWRA